MSEAVNPIIFIIFIAIFIILMFIILAMGMAKLISGSNAGYNEPEPKAIEEPQEEEEEPIADFSQDLWDMEVRRLVNIRNAAMMTKSCENIEEACNELLRRYVDGERTMKLYNEMNNIQFVGKWEAYVL